MRRIAVLLLTAALVVGIAGPTAAADWGTGGTGDDKPSKPKPSKPKPGSGGSSGSGGGDLPAGYWSASGTVWGNPASKTIKTSSKTTTLRCSGGNSWGKFLGMRWTAWGRTGGLSTGTGQTLDGTTKACVDAPHFLIENRRCVTKVTGAISAVYSNADGTPVSHVNLGTSKTAFEKSGRKDMSKCSSTFSKSFTYSEDRWGQYNGTAVASEVVVTQKRFTTANARTGKRPATQTLSVGAERKVNPVSVWWSQSCSHGVEKGKKSRDFTGDGCKTDDSTSEWKCVLPSTAFPYLSEVRNNQPIDVFHDAKKRPLTWKTLPTVSGDVRKVTAKKVRLDYLSGSPWRSGVAVAAKNQHFGGTPALGSWLDGWNAGGSAGQATWQMRFYKAGLPGKPLALRPTYGFTAEFKHVYATVTGIKSDGTLVFSKKSKWSKSSATCLGIPSRLAIVRSRISN